MATTGRLHPFSQREWMSLEEGGDLLSAEAHVAGHISSIGFNTQTNYTPTLFVRPAQTGVIVLDACSRSFVAWLVCRCIGLARLSGRR